MDPMPKMPKKQRSLASLLGGKDEEIDPATGKRKISGALAGIIHAAKMKKGMGT